MIEIESMKIDGFATKCWLNGESMRIETKNILSSNDKLFFDRVEWISSTIPGLNMNNISSFLIIIDKNYKARMYINDEIMLTMWIKPKRDIKKGEGIHKNDIIDIINISFHNIEVTEEDRVIYCQKVEWKFFLYYDLWRTENTLDVEKMYQELWTAYRSLFFEKTYLNLKEPSSKEALNNWWFPFIEIINNYQQIINFFYEEESRRNIFLYDFINKYDNKIDELTNKWRNKEIFAQKKDIIQSWLDNYKQNNQSGIISCIKTLASEIEWIIRVIYYQDKNFSKNSQKEPLKEYINNIVNYWKNKETTLFFPDMFLSFLTNIFFENWFIWEGEDPQATRHTVNHWILPSSWYTKEKAFQMILILDQIYFYLP